MSTQPKVIVYTTKVCAYCKQAKEFLKAKNIEFTEADVFKDIEARNRMMNKTGQMSVPILEIGNKWVVGFDRIKILEALKG